MMRQASMAAIGAAESPKDLDPASSAFFTYVAMLCSIGGVIVQFFGNGFLTSNFYPFVTFSIENLAIFNYFDAVLITTVSLGIASVVVNFFLGFTALTRNKICVKILFVVSFLIALMLAALGGGLLFFIEQTKTSVSEGISSDTQSEFANQLGIYSLALYTGCCENGGRLDSLTRTKREITDNPNDVGLDDNLLVGDCADIGGSGKKEDYLKVGGGCYEAEDLDEYEFYLKVANPTKFACKELEGAKVSLKGVKIPGSSFDATILTDGEEEVTIVADSDEYGCGAGKPLAFQYAFFVWFEQTITPLAITALVVGLIEILALIIVGGNLCCNFDQDDDNIYSDYLEDDQAAFVAQQTAQMNSVNHYDTPSQRSVPQRPQSVDRNSLRKSAQITTSPPPSGRGIAYGEIDNKI